jgi:uncharacterized membrane protein YphA (DoxX/SURF4 family)
MESKNTSSPAASNSRTIAYRITTALVAANLGVGAVCDILQIPYIRAMALHLGYPRYLAYILGVWEVFGMVALLIPRFPLLKEWAYAGAFFLFTGAVASRIAVGDGTGMIVPPIIFTGLTVASWYLRPSTYKL